MSTTYKLETLADILSLSPEEFFRMLPDLVVWYEFSKQFPPIDGLTKNGFLWTDDGVNEVTHVQLTNTGTGEVTEFNL